MNDPNHITLGRSDGAALILRMANRHGLIAGATGTGKTVTLQTLAEGLSRAGVPVLMADVKGDLSGLAQPGTRGDKIKARLATFYERLNQHATERGGALAPAASARRGREPDTMITSMAKSAAHAIGSQLGRQIVRGVLGSLLGGGRR